MKEIKFRAWDAGANEMYYEMSDEPFIISMDCGKLIIGVDNGDDDYYELGHIMQYTGLNDKNDKEIYEGDIIQRVIDSTEGERRLAFGPVVFHFGGFCMSCEGLLYPLSGQFQICEVIGNIYQNPELLKP